MTTRAVLHLFPSINIAYAVLRHDFHAIRDMGFQAVLEGPAKRIRFLEADEIHIYRQCDREEVQVVLLRYYRCCIIQHMPEHELYDRRSVQEVMNWVKVYAQHRSVPQV